jgi:hypothetical protein
MDVHVPGREARIFSVSVALQDVRRIFERLKQLVVQDGDLEISKLPQPTDLTEDQWLQRKKDIRQGAFRVTITLEGAGGDRLHGDDESIFSSPNIPNRISSVYMTNTTAFRWWTNTNPKKSFELYLDFSKPKLLDSETYVSAPTPNQSNMKIEADNQTWIASVSDAVFGVLDERKSSRSLLHRAFVYDIGLLALGIPFGLYLAWKSSAFIETKLGSINTLLSATAYVYVMLMAIWLYRILFGYTKWIFPSVELKESSSSSASHRAFWFTIIAGLVVNFVWEFSI